MTDSECVGLRCTRHSPAFLGLAMTSTRDERCPRLTHVSFYSDPHGDGWASRHDTSFVFTQCLFFSLSHLACGLLTSKKNEKIKNHPSSILLRPTNERRSTTVVRRPHENKNCTKLSIPIPTQHQNRKHNPTFTTWCLSLQKKKSSSVQLMLETR